MKKFNKKFYIYNFVIKAIGFAFLSMFFVLSALVDPETDTFFFDQKIIIIWLVVFVLYIICLSIYEVVLYQKSGYSIDDDGVRCKRGVFFKKNSFLRYEKMHAINERQGLIQRMFGIEGLYIDSGSTNTASQAEIAIYESKQEIKNILALIEAKKNHQSSEEAISAPLDETKELKPIFFFTRKEKVKYLLVNLLQTLVALGILLVIFTIITLLVRQIENFFIAFAVMILVFIELICAIAFVIESFVSQYDFKVYKTDKELIVKHGFFVKVDNKLPLKKIKAIRTKTTLWDRIYGYARISVDVVGFDGTTSEGGGTATAGILIPYAKKEEISSYINSLIDGYDYQGEPSYKSRGIFPRMSVATLIFAIIASFVALIIILLFALGCFELKWFAVALLSVIASYLVLVGLWALFKLIAHRNEGIEIEDNRLIISSGGYFNSKVVVKKENVIAIEDITTHLRQKKDIYSYKIHIYSNSLRNTIRVNILDKDVREKLLEFLNVDYIKY